MGRIVEVPLVDAQDALHTFAAPTPDFQIYTAGIESVFGQDRLVHTVASSTEEDLHGDSMSLSALNDMSKAPTNLTIWLNHDYTLPDSIFGSLHESSIQHTDGIADLHLHFDVELDNPGAARVKRYIDNGRRLGTSVGCIVTKYEVPEEEDGENWFGKGIIIHGVRVLEYSIVGIPANQRSWVENAIRGLFTKTHDPKLAPAMKSLWPKAYTDVTKALSKDEREYLDQLPTRKSPALRLDWVAAKKTFLISKGEQSREVGREEVATIVKKSIEETQHLNARVEAIVEPEITATACGSTSWPLNTDRSWDKGSAHGRLLEWAGGKENFSAGKFKRVHFRYTGDGSKISDFHFPFCDIVDGKVTAIWHAVTASAAALGGARGGASKEGDEGAMRSKIAAYYRKAGETPPWEGDSEDKGMEDELETKEAEDIVTKDNQHAPVDGDHSHDHMHEDGTNHSHSHTHSGDTNHGHLHTGVNEGDPDHDGDIDVPGQPDNDPQDNAESVTASFNDQQIAQLAIYNNIGKMLGLPEIDAKQAASGEHPIVTKAGIMQRHHKHLQAIHKHLTAISDQVCGNGEDMGEDETEAHAASGKAISQSQQDYAVAPELITGLQTLSASLDNLNVSMVQKDVETTKNELIVCKQQLAQLASDLDQATKTVANLRNMPLGNPLFQLRSVQPGEVTASELLAIKNSEAAPADTLAQALALTSEHTEDLANGQKITYRHWPEAVGKGVRPQLTTNQMMFMSWEHIRSYQNNGEANVPKVDDPAERLRS